MARPLRIEYPGALYHVTSRGNARGDIYRDETDRDAFLDVLAETASRFGWLLHAYCLMTNHYHLLVETPQPNLSRGMRQLNGVYTQQYHRRHETTGHLLEGRYKAIVVERESYLLELSRYIVLNPVRAGLVTAPADWPWSSYQPAIGEGPTPPFLHTDWLLAQFGTQRSAAQASYRQFVAKGVGEPGPWQQLRGRVVLGSEAFATACRRHLPAAETLVEVPQPERQVRRPDLADLLTGWAAATRLGRDELAHRACVECEYRLREVAQFVGCHPSTVSLALRRHQERIRDFKT